MRNSKKIFLFIALLVNLCLFAQDKIYKKSGGIIECKITDILEDKVFYKALNSDDLTKEMKKADIDIIRYANGKMEDYSAIGAEKNEVNKESKKEDKFDRNSEDFVGFANALARQMSESILLKMAGKVENSSVAVYYDSVYKDVANGDINIPIKITYEKYNALNNGFIKGTIKVKSDGSKVWVFENAGKE